MEKKAPAARRRRGQLAVSSSSSMTAPSKFPSLSLIRFFFLASPLLFVASNARELRRARPDPCAPTEVHLALTDIPTTLRVLWSSVSPDCSPQLELGVLRSGVEEDDVARELRGGTKTASGENSSPLPSPSSLDPFFSFVSADVEATLERASYSSADLCGPPASRNDGEGEKNLYAAELRGLEPGKLYAYRLFGGSSLSSSYSAEASSKVVEASFRAPPEASGASGATVLVFGDMGDAQHPRGKDPGAQLVADAVAAAVDDATWRRGQRGGEPVDGDDDEADDSEDLSLSSVGRRRRRGSSGGGRGKKKNKPAFPAGGPPLVLNVGDISYADGDPRGWERFMNQVQGSASRAPYGVAAGNHDVGWERGSEEDDEEDDDEEGSRKCEGGDGVCARRRNVAVRDAAGFSQPYLPDWGDGASAAFGPDSRGECGVPMAARFAAFGAPSKKGRGGDVDGDDGSSSSSSSCFAPLRRPRPPPPADPTEPVRPFWYSFEHGPIHFVVVSTEHSLEPGSRQRAWLEAHLKLGGPGEEERGGGGGGERGIDRCRTPWVVLAAHRPMYVPYPHKANRLAGERLRQSLEPLVDAAGFDLVLSGHVHSFARSCNAAGLRCVSRTSGGAVHYTLGCGGRKLSGVEGVDDQPAWIAAAEDRWGFLRIDADGADSGTLTASFVRAEDGTVGDSVVLYAAERPPAHACRGRGGGVWGGGGGGSSRGNASVVAAAAVEVEVA